MNANVTAPVEWVEAVGKLCLPLKADGRLQELMDRKNENDLSIVERAELESLVEVSQQLSLVRAKALQLLGQREEDVLKNWDEKNRVAMKQSQQGLSKPLDDEAVVGRMRSRLAQEGTPD